MPALRRRLLHAFSLEIAQISQSAAGNGRHSILHRCAKWLLMALDCIESNELPLTQEFLAIMLAVRRPSVTMALNRLQRDGLIRNHRGVITIVDLPGLKRVACECYVHLKEFDQRLSTFDKAGTQCSVAHAQMSLRRQFFLTISFYQPGEWLHDFVCNACNSA